MSLVKDFEAIGAKARVVQSTGRRLGPDGFSINIVHEGRDEIFEIRQDPKVDVGIEVVDKKPEDRHLLLMVRNEARPGVPSKTKFLCGHDEFHWFAAPVRSGVADVQRAKESLKPNEVVSVQQGSGKGRHGKAGVKRQGEWFFIPKPSMKVPKQLILRNEPIRREGGGKPHIVEEVYRLGGETVYERFGAVIDFAEYSRRMRKDPKSIQGFRMARVNARVYGRGKVRHPDHSTIELSHWYQIVPNTEHQFARTGLRFID